MNIIMEMNQAKRAVMAHSLEQSSSNHNYTLYSHLYLKRIHALKMQINNVEQLPSSSSNPLVIIKMELLYRFSVQIPFFVKSVWKTRFFY